MHVQLGVTVVYVRQILKSVVVLILFGNKSEKRVAALWKTCSRFPENYIAAFRKLCTARIVHISYTIYYCV